MPPRKRAAKAAAAAPAAPPLEDCIIALSGTFAGHSHVTLESYITSLGGTVVKSVTKKVTHLVTTQEDFDGGNTKVAAAKKNDIHIVSQDWALESETNGTRASEADFGFASRANGTQANASQASPPATSGPAQANGSKVNGSNGVASKKRAIVKASSDSDDDSAPAPDAKKQKAANGKKAAAPAAPELKKEKEVVADGQIAKSKDVMIPLDEGCPWANYRVYIDPSGIIYDASLNQTHASHNNNKFYRIQLLQEGSLYKTWTRWGRVGERGQTATLGNGSLNDAMNLFDKKFKDKSGLRWADRGSDPKPSKYAFIERSYNPDSDDEDGADDAAEKVKAKTEESGEVYEPPKCTLEKPVAELMELIFNQQYFAAAMTALNYDANKLPLGKLSKTTITRGFQALKDLSALLDDPTLAQSKYGRALGPATEQLSNMFYTLIPHAFGRNRPPIIQNNDMLKREIELLESLSDMKDASDIMKKDSKTEDTIHFLDRQFQMLGMEEMSVLDSESSEFTLLTQYLNGSKGSTHGINYQVQDIFRIERQGEFERFDKSDLPTKKSDRRLLWHGSRATNFGGILSQGLRIAPPEAPVNGYMFGKGVYLADMSTKSANYCVPSISNRHALLLLCEAELGDPMLQLTHASYSAAEDAKKNGSATTWGMGNTGPSKWMDAGCVHPSLKGTKMPDVSVAPGATNVAAAYLMYNEYICYDISQIRLRYLLRVKM